VTITNLSGDAWGIDNVSYNFSTVPEASTWAMMLAGFAGLGFAGYRKARSSRTALSLA
jgi:PEP-CTERM motif